MKKLFLFLHFAFYILHSQAQNVGIGTDTPTEKFDVVGTIKSDSAKHNSLLIPLNAGNGKVLTSDAVGYATWKDNNAMAAGNKGYGVWGDCATNGNISEYEPVADSGGASGNYFGHSTALSGDFAIVGAPSDKVTLTGQGSASIYFHTDSGWMFMQKLTDPFAEASDQFGISVGISGDYAIVGAPYDDEYGHSNQGSACIFRFNGTSWDFVIKLNEAAGLANDNFGYSVAISGNHAAVGEPYNDVLAASAGAITVYYFNGTNWAFKQKLVDPTGAALDNFGFGVALSGNYLIAGSPYDDINFTDQGSACIFSYNGGSWLFKQKITDENTSSANDYFGTSVSISGNDAVVGVVEDDIVHGSSTANNQGSASVFHYDGTQWSRVQKFSDTSSIANIYMGNNVSISGDYIIVGAWQDDIGSIGNRGSATLYRRLGTVWQRLQKIIDSGFSGGADFFGSGVSVESATKRFVIGCRGYQLNVGKAVFGKIN